MHVLACVAEMCACLVCVVEMYACFSMCGRNVCVFWRVWQICVHVLACVAEMCVCFGVCGRNVFF